MFHLGQYQLLTVLRETDPGLFLGNEAGDEVLLPHKYKPHGIAEGDYLEVFVYLDNEERPIATTERPYLTLNTFGFLCCSEVNKYGAFMDWGLVKQLFVPFAEQAMPMKANQWYIVYLYLDEKTQRLVGSSKTNRFLDNDEVSLNRMDEVEILVTQIGDQGASVIVNNQHRGLIFIDDIFEDIRRGDRLKAYVKKVREDKKLDIVLQKPGYESIEPNAAYILNELEAAGGFLPLHDKTDPELIKNELGLSKKSFKKAIGSLYKEKKISIGPDGISLIH